MKRIWRTLSIKKKLITTFLLVTILSSCSGIISLFLMSSADRQYSNALTYYGFSQGDIGLLMSSLNSNTSNIMTMMATNDETIVKNAQTRINENANLINQYMTAVEATLSTDEERAYYNTIKENLPKFTESATKVIELATQNRNEEAMETYQNQAAGYVEKINEATQKLMSMYKDTGTQLSVSLTKTNRITIVSMIALVVIMIVVSLTIALVIAVAIANPMSACSKRLVQLADGDLESPVPCVDSKDETGVLAEASADLVKKLQSVIQEMSTVLGNIAEGNLDLPHLRDYSGDFAPLNKSSNKILDSLNDAFNQILQSAEQVSSGADQVSSGAQALSQGATEQASSVEELAATINEISNKVKQNADSALEARTESNVQEEQIAESNHKMQEMIEAMGRISDKSGEIGKIIKTIEDISFQTNILALNAAVEAARAGEAGKGFAVVADEVRSLAGKSSQAAKETTVLISETVQAVEDGTSIADATAGALQNVVTSSKHVTRLVEEIAKASEEQSSAIAQVTMGVDQISSVVQTNSATSEESAAASEELAGQAQLMNELVRRFNLKK